MPIEVIRSGSYRQCVSYEFEESSDGDVPDAAIMSASNAPRSLFDGAGIFTTRDCQTAQSIGL